MQTNQSLKQESTGLGSPQASMPVPPLPRPPVQPPTERSPQIRFPWTPDLGNGTYQNPILFADYSDPDVARAGDDFYLTASSFNCTPALPILHSRDLVNWKLINYAVQNLPHSRFKAVQHGCGVWAPAIRFHNDRWWIFFPMPDEGLYVTTTSHPAERWGPPRLLQAGRGLIDPCPLWDDDGKAYLIHAYANSRSGIKDLLRVRPMAPDGSRLLGEGQIVFHAPGRHPTVEGPKLLKRDGWYYILAPAGGVSTGWQLVLRSRNIFGPYEEKIVLQQGATAVNGPHQGALVDTPAGEWWFMHFQCAGLYGRVVHLQPVRWEDGWPLMGRDIDGNGIGEPVLSSTKPKISVPAAPAVPDTTDEFDSPALGLQWQWHANHDSAWFALDPQRSRLRLQSQFHAASSLADLPNLLLQKFPARSFTVETEVEFAPKQIDEEAGLVVMGQQYAALALCRTANGLRLYLRLNNSHLEAGSVSGKSVRLRVEVRDGGLCRFSYANGPRFITIPHEFQATKGTWIGAKVGLYALRRIPDGPGGFAEFDYFRFSPVAE